jgi:hypothetical protein
MKKYIIGLAKEEFYLSTEVEAEIATLKREVEDLKDINMSLHKRYGPLMDEEMERNMFPRTPREG